MKVHVNKKSLYYLLASYLICFVYAQTNNLDETTGAGQSVNKFALLLLSETANKLGDTENLALSPYTLWTLLSIISEGAVGNTRAQLESVLGLHGNTKEIRRNFRNLRTNLMSNDVAIQLDLSNAIFIINQTDLKSQFQSVAKNDYSTDVIRENSGITQKSVEIINDYIANTTKYRIKEFVMEDDLKESRILLVSALFFKGQWLTRFNTTVPGRFYDEQDRDKGNVTMMYLRADFPYTNLTSIKCHAVEIPYGQSNKYSMIVLLPFKKEKLSSVLEKLQKAGFVYVLDALDKAARDFEGEEVNVYLPRFSIKSSLTLNLILENMGLRDIFNSSTSELTNIADAFLYVTRVLHQSNIQVNEEGTVATSASGAGLGYRTLPPKFNANRDFAYFIAEKQTRTIIFAGKVTNPSTI